MNSLVFTTCFLLCCWPTLHFRSMKLTELWVLSVLYCIWLLESVLLFLLNILLTEFVILLLNWLKNVMTLQSIRDRHRVQWCFSCIENDNDLVWLIACDYSAVSKTIDDRQLKKNQRETEKQKLNSWVFIWRKTTISTSTDNGSYFNQSFSIPTKVQEQSPEGPPTSRWGCWQRWREWWVLGKRHTAARGGRRPLRSSPSAAHAASSWWVWSTPSH